MAGTLPGHSHFWHFVGTAVIEETEIVVKEEQMATEREPPMCVQAG